jgi:hypothetical protein
VVDIGVRRAPIAAHCAAGQVTGPDEFVKCGARPVARLGFWLGIQMIGDVSDHPLIDPTQFG